MSMICWIAGHDEGGSEVWNQGYYFGRCGRCGQDLIRTSGEWRPVPLGYQVAWKSGAHRHALASDFRRNLPRSPDEPRRWRLGLHHHGVAAICLPAPPAARRREESRKEREEGGGLPHILLLGIIAALGLATRLSTKARAG